MKNAIFSLLHPRKVPLRLCMLAFGGIMAGACITFPTIPGMILQWFAYIPAALVLFSASDDDISLPRRLGRAWRYGFFFFMCEYLVVYHWFFSFYPLDFTGMSHASAAVVVLLAWLGLSFLASIAGGFVFLMFELIARGKTAKKAPIALPFIGGALFAVFEWVETLGWLGVPWGRVALGQLATDYSPTVQSASIFGSYFVCFVIVSFSFLLAQALLCERRAAMLRTLIALLLAAANAMFGVCVCFIQTDTEELSVAALQGNISSRDKFEITIAETVAVYSRLATEAADSGASLILTPESAFPWSLLDDSASLSVFCNIALDNDVELVLGCLDGTGEGQQNILIHVTSNGEVSDVEYSKRHLVPFGEYMPWRDFFDTVVPPLAEISLLQYDLAAGTDTAIMTLSDGTNVGGLICFDSIYEELATASVRDGAELLLLGTNDSWFTDSAAVYMHNAQARLRAVETGVPIVRAANTGISSVIDSRGRVLDSLPPLVEGIICCDVSTGEASIYARTGNVFVYFLAAVCLLIPVLDMLAKIKCRRTARKKNDKNRI